jgi:hypothetical protein
MAEHAGPTILVDFDGVIHRYSQGWHDGTAYDIPFDGAREGLVKLEEMGFTVVIFSTRDKLQIIEWLAKYDFEPYDITNEKIPAIAIIDDRAIRFVQWSQAIMDVRTFHPRNR